MDEVIINGITYTIDLTTKSILWKESELNYRLRFFRHTIDEDLPLALSVYKTTETNEDLLVAAGKDLSNLKTEIVKHLSDSAQFTPDDVSNPGLTITDLKKWINIAMLRHFGYEPYDPENNFELKPQE